MSDLRERLLAVAEQTDMYALKEIHWSGYVEVLWPSIEAELQKEQREIARWIRNCQVLIEETNAAHQETLSWKASAQQNYAEWEEANKKIERVKAEIQKRDQTIESLRAEIAGMKAAFNA